MKFILITLYLVSTSLYAEAKKEIQFTEVLFNEVSPGLDPYSYRILVNKDYVRFDAGADNDGFILYNRANKVIQSVNHEDKSRVTISVDEAEYKGKKVKVETLSKLLDKAPQVQNSKAQLHDIVGNETLCRQVMSFSGLLPEVTSAWTEFELVMQQKNQSTLSRTPQDMQTDCFIVNNITHAEMFLSFGLPYSVKSSDGTLRVLRDFSEVTKPSSFIEIPKTYQEFKI